MSTFVLCPECGSNLGQWRPFMLEVIRGMEQEISDQIHVDKRDLNPDLIKPIGFLLDALGIKRICCRMHAIPGVNRQ